MKVKDLMQTKPVFLDPDVSIYEVWKTIYKKNLMALPIVKDKKLVGIISIADLLKRIYPSYDQYEWDPSTRDLESIEKNAEEVAKLTAKEVMAKRVYYVKKDISVLAALSKMIVNQVRQLPVVDDNMHLIGIILRHDIFDSLFKQYLKK